MLKTLTQSQIPINDDGDHLDADNDDDDSNGDTEDDNEDNDDDDDDGHITINTPHTRVKQTIFLKKILQLCILPAS